MFDNEGKKNRVASAVLRMEAQIAKRIADGITTKEKVESTREALNMEFDEYCKFQELKSLAFAQGIITIDEANTLYGYLGTIPDTFNRQSAAVKSVLTQFYTELLRARIRAK